MTINWSIQKAVFTLLFSWISLHAAISPPEHYSWHAIIIDEKGQPVPYANVVAPMLSRGTTSDEKGHVVLDHLPAGLCEVNINVIGYVNLSIETEIPQLAGQVAIIALQHTILEGSVVTVTVTGLPTDILHSERTVSVMEGDALQRHTGQSLSATISKVPGVQLLSQGHAVAKPVIRGMSNQRIVILKDGVRMEGQQWGGHHSPEADVLSLGRIEVVRGPMGLIFGSEALGGVIQLQSPKLKSLDEGGEGFLVSGRLGFHANSKQSLGGIGFQKAWQNSALRINTHRRISDDYAVPGDQQFLKRVPGTAFEQSSTNLHFMKKYLHHSLDILGTHYAEMQTLIGEGHWHSTGGGESGDEPWFHVLGSIKSPTLHQNLTLKGQWMLAHSWLEYDGSVQHNHREGGPEGEEPAVNISTDTYSANLRWRHVVQDQLPGTIGINIMQKVSESLGVERLLPDYTSNSMGIYGYYRWKLQDFTFSGGLRLDANQYDIYSSNFPGLGGEDDIRRQYFPVSSGGVGLIWNKSQMPYSLAMNIGSGWRPPSPYELFINGVHHGDWKIEVGDPKLQAEQSLNTDIILRHVDDSHSGELTFFYNQLRDYIISSPTGIHDDQTGIPIYYILQGDAQTYGSEMRLEYLLNPLLRADIGWDIMWGEFMEDVKDVDGDGQQEQSLPAINPPRILGGLSLQTEQLWGLNDVSFELGGEYVFPQTNLAEYENLVDDSYGGLLFIEPEAYTLINVSIHAKVLMTHSTLDFSLGIENVLNTQYYSHLSRYKGLAYNQGLNLHGELRFSF